MNKNPVKAREVQAARRKAAEQHSPAEDYARRAKLYQGSPAPAPVAIKTYRPDTRIVRRPSYEAAPGFTIRSLLDETQLA
jgi:hypothetical protein